MPASTASASLPLPVREVELRSAELGEVVWWRWRSSRSGVRPGEVEPRLRAVGEVEPRSGEAVGEKGEVGSSGGWWGGGEVEQRPVELEEAMGRWGQWRAELGERGRLGAVEG